MAKNNGRGGSSLQDQMRKVGLVSEKQLRKAQNGLHRKDVREKHGAVDESKVEAKQLLDEKLARDREKNAAMNLEKQRKALAAQINQLVKSNSQRQRGDVAYKFSDQGVIKTLYISTQNKVQLNQGFLAIVKAADGYDMVPEQVARRIMARQEGVVLYLYERSRDVIAEDDPYKDFQIPDDLEW